MTRIFSGIQPTGTKHLGNLIGALQPWVAWQERAEGIYCIVDLHATTVPYDPSKLRSSVYDLAALMLAVGLDPERCILVRQSEVTAHSELAWLLNSVTAYGELGRMTQFKDKSARQELVTAGLFNYPVLQAADVLAYRADAVPVGEDQRQHIELMRNLAERFNARFGETLVVPEGIFPEVGARIMDLQAPERKMSTTGGSERGTIYVLDEPDAIQKKFRSAVTDSDGEIRYAKEKPGVSNLLEILAVVSGVPVAETEREFAGQGYGTLKGAVGEATAAYLAPIRERYGDLRADEARLEATLAAGAEKARAVTGPVMADVHGAMGLGPV
jgi:tryptophanyl-tRNA synthetase